MREQLESSIRELEMDTDEREKRSEEINAQWAQAFVCPLCLRLTGAQGSVTPVDLPLQSRTNALPIMHIPPHPTHNLSQQMIRSKKMKAAESHGTGVRM